jgi:hypothetical protein
MDWTPLVSTVAGAAIAFGGTVVADQLRRRDSRHRYSYGERQRASMEMVLALGAALERLRAVGGTEARAGKLRFATSDAMTKSGVYTAREKLLMCATPSVARASEDAFAALVAVRDAVRDGAGPRTPVFHDAYHPYAEKMWDLRTAIRDDLGAPRIDWDAIGRDDRTTCDVCATAQAAPGQHAVTN